MTAFFRTPAHLLKAGKLAVAAATAMAALAVTAPGAKAAEAGTLDSWIRESLLVMRAHNIPGSYTGIYRTIMRESSGDQYAINLWDSNARAGHPSKGLMQVIAPTFGAYHVYGTSWYIYDPIANITAACNYAAHVYGSIDNVSAY